MKDKIKDHLKYLYDKDYDLDFRDLYKFHQNIWITQEHKNYIPLAEMSVTHIINSIALIDRNEPDCVYGLGGIWKPKLEEELKRRKHDEVL